MFEMTTSLDQIFLLRNQALKNRIKNLEKYKEFVNTTEDLKQIEIID